MINIKLSHKDCAPVVGTEYSAGMDLKAYFAGRDHAYAIELKAGETLAIDTGVAAEIPEGWVGLVFPRSSVGTKMKCSLANTTGVIDSDYRGNIKIMLRNYGTESQLIYNFDRLVQLVVVPHYSTTYNIVEELSDTTRGSGGFGSTGK